MHAQKKSPRFAAQLAQNTVRLVSLAGTLAPALIPGTALAADTSPVGGFGSYSFIDAIALGVIIFVLFRLVSRGFGRRNKPDERPPRRDNVSRFPGRDQNGRQQDSNGEPSQKEASDAYRRAQQTWDYLSSKPRDRSGQTGQQGQPGQQDRFGRRPGTPPPPIDVDSMPDPGGPQAGVPSGGETSYTGTTSRRIDVRNFDEDDFLNGAKAVYARIQESWDARDLEDIRDFVGDQVYSNLTDHARRNPQPGKTDILLIEAKVLEVRHDNADLTASVLYDVLLRKKGAKANSKIKEIWHFRKPADDTNAFWKVEGIQQVH
ncbi:Tim44 domain-containing protein [Oceanidesulfovibrio marinus]|uniref:Tim44 domain-containing protein n=1 Tax=Oceanidesulfovibrio marinus TaxID=370038 RepID=A0ABX6NEI3_9BACT|nr:Tim44 domain-containing protein [Oceanidesulfovibrio marinus]